MTDEMKVLIEKRTAMQAFAVANPCHTLEEYAKTIQRDESKMYVKLSETRILSLCLTVSSEDRDPQKRFWCVSAAVLVKKSETEFKVVKRFLWSNAEKTTAETYLRFLIKNVGVGTAPQIRQMNTLSFHRDLTAAENASINARNN